MLNFSSFKYLDWLRLLGLAFVYAILARLVLFFSSNNDNVTIFWLPGGLALAALLIWGARFWPAVFVGAFSVGLWVNDPPLLSIIIALGNVLETLCAVWVLNHLGFNLGMERSKDFFYLSLTAIVVSLISAVVGPVALMLEGWVTLSNIAATSLHWWQADFLGIILGTPFLLIWQTWPKDWLKTARLLELVVLFSIVFIVGQIDFFDWFHQSIANYSKLYWFFLLITIAAIRFGRHGALLLSAMVALQALWGASQHLGYFHQDLLDTGLQVFWFFQLTLTLNGLVIAMILRSRNQINFELQKNQQFLSSLIENSGAVVFVKDRQGVYQLINRQWEIVTGLSRDFVIGKQDAEIFPSSSAQQFQRNDLEIMSNASVEQLEEVLERPDGQRYFLSVKFPLIDPNGDVSGVCGMATEITERKRAEQWLSLYGEMVRNMAEGLHLTRVADGRIVYVNPALERMFAYPTNELEGKHISILNAPGDELPEVVADRIIAELMQKGSWQGEIKNIRKDGTAFWCYAVVSSFSHPLWGAVWLSIHQDITTRKLLEDELRQSEANLRAFIENAPVALAMFDLNMHYLVASRRWLDDFALADRNITGLSHYALFPELPQVWKNAHQRGLAGEVVHCEEDSFVKPTGEVVWGRWVIQPWYKTNNEVGGIVIFSEDITERKKNEESLRLAMLVYQNSSEAMIVTELDGTIVAVNPAFSASTGYSAEEVIGNNPKLLSSGRHDDGFYEELWRSLDDSGSWKGEVWNRRKNGELYIESLSINTVFRSNGTPWRRVALFSDITEQKAAEDLLWRHANLDPLTGLSNRRMFYEQLSQEIKKSHRTRLPLALLFLDLDRFKEVNDTLGHIRGDSLLKEAGQRLLHCVRNTDSVSRLGGDEFTIILYDLDAIEHVDRVAQAVLSSLSQPYQLSDQVIYLSVSIGITLYPNDASDIEQLVKNADQAMYAAKDQGRNCYRYFTHSMQAAADDRLRLTNELRIALSGQQFEVYYQPIIDLKSRQICKAEALIRWNHPGQGQIPPSQFIPIAEDIGLIHEIGDWVFHQAAEQTKVWRQSIHPDFQISVNKSPVQFQDSKDRHHEWTAFLNQIGLPGDSLVIEITEGLLLDAKSTTYQMLLDYRDCGINIAIDDFGTGYSALSYLKKFDIDFLKIDQSFTRNLGPQSSDLALCEAIIVMAHKLGLKVIAEGVETEQQLKLLQQIDCDYGQGYYFSKPLPVNEFNERFMP